MADIIVPCPRCGARKYISASTSKAATERRDWVLANRPLCNDCIGDIAYEAAAARAGEMQLPRLEGTDVQIKLGERARIPALLNLMLRLERPISKLAPRSEEEIESYGNRQDALTWLSNCRDAVWWVEHRTLKDDQLVSAALEEVVMAQRPGSNRALVDAVETEAMILPKKKPVGSATIRMHNGIEIIVPGNMPALRNVLHGLGFEWWHKGKRWIQPDVGSAIAVAAGQALLEIGFSVRVLDNDVRKRIKNRKS